MWNWRHYQLNAGARTWRMKLHHCHRSKSISSAWSNWFTIGLRNAQSSANFISRQNTSHQTTSPYPNLCSSCHPKSFMSECNLGGKILNEIRRRKWERQISWQQVKHQWLYSDPLWAWKGRLFVSSGFLDSHNFCAHGTSQREHCKDSLNDWLPQ